MKLHDLGNSIGSSMKNEQYSRRYRFATGIPQHSSNIDTPTSTSPDQWPQQDGEIPQKEDGLVTMLGCWLRVL